MGAEHFEAYLLDYDPCSNWGNWTYSAGVGSDPRVFSNFNSKIINILKKTFLIIRKIDTSMWSNKAKITIPKVAIWYIGSPNSPKCPTGFCMNLTKWPNKTEKNTESMNTLTLLSNCSTPIMTPKTRPNNNMVYLFIQEKLKEKITKKTNTINLKPIINKTC